MAYAPPNTLDPTNVMGRRIGAWIIDFIPAVIIVGIFSRNGATTYTNVPSGFCTDFKLTHNGYFCFQSGSTAYTNHGLAGGALLIWLLYYFVLAGLLQGATGATPGKHIVGLRVVDANGNICGIGRALLRTLLGVFEIGFCFLVALITASVTHPHRRVGDFAAGTYVVAKGSVGVPIVHAMGGSGYPQAWTPPAPAGWAPPPTGGPQTWGTPQPGWGTPPGATPPPSAAPPAWGTPAASPPPAQTPTTWGAPPAAGPVPADAPTAQPTPAPTTDAPGWASPAPQAQVPQAEVPAAQVPQAQVPQTQAPAPQAQTPAPSAREPQWDAQRNAWVFWEVETQRWLQHDPATGQWGPLR